MYICVIIQYNNILEQTFALADSVALFHCYGCVQGWELYIACAVVLFDCNNIHNYSMTLETLNAQYTPCEKL